ncbi:MAG: flagellar hook basal-body protein [Planctomycetes bacterium]|nr:flagellar hook basal-body protein [Planctomycetota bacterium]
MNDGFHAAASSMAACMTQLEIATSNAVNANTPGYIPRGMALRPFETALDRELGQEASLVQVQEHTSFQNGIMTSSKSPLTAAISGDGFFVVDTPQGEAFTRNGDFMLDAGGTLVTRAGYAVQGASGALRAEPNGGPVEIRDGGSIVQDGQLLGTLRIADVADKSVLERAGDTLFLNPTGAPSTDVNEPNVKGRMLELPAERGVAGLVGMIAANREFESAQRVISVLNKSYEKLINRG